MLPSKLHKLIALFSFEILSYDGIFFTDLDYERIFGQVEDAGAGLFRLIGEGGGQLDGAGCVEAAALALAPAPPPPRRRYSSSGGRSWVWRQLG